MIIYDISWPIHPQMTTYKDRGGIVFEWIKTLQDDNARESRICMGSHVGTHIDAAAHFNKEGDFIDEVGLDKLIGWAHVLDFTHVDDVITYEDLAQHTISEHEIVLLKTKNSVLPESAAFNGEFIYLDASGASYLAEKNVKAVGIDYLGIERNQPGHETHTLLFNKHIPIIEGLRLLHIEAGTYYLFCLPLRIQGLEAAPARAILVKDED